MENNLNEQIKDSVDASIISAKTAIESEKKIIYERLDIINLAIVVMCGIGLIVSIFYGAKEVANAIGGGLVGYLSKNSANK
jgi:hypothetical protein